MHVGVVLLLLVQDSGDLSAMTRKDSQLGAALGRFSLALRDLRRPSEGEILPECFWHIARAPQCAVKRGNTRATILFVARVRR